MNDARIEILEYLTRDGRNPFRKWLEGLRDRQARSRIRVRLNRIRLGNFGDCKSVGSGVSELRVPYGPGYCVYFGRRDSKVVILLYGGHKKTQSGDIALAREYWNDYLRRVKAKSD